MIRLIDPWLDVAPDTPSGQLHARRVDASHPHDFFWAWDAHGHRLLVYRSANIVVDRKLPNLRGIAIEISPNSLILRLAQDSELEIFSTLCWSLIERTRIDIRGSEVFDCVIMHLDRWQRFLGKGLGALLSDQEIRGLFCELIFLESELISRFGLPAIAFWRGPAGDPQDFSVGTTLFEIKSHVAGSSPVLMVSSAEQLWHAAGNLFLVAYTIGEATEEVAGTLSLAGLVARVRTMVASSDWAEAFEDRLMEVGYTEHHEYGRQFFIAANPDMFLVEEGFPRITKDAVHAGVCRVKYGIELAACSPFRRMPDWFALGVPNGH